MVQDVKTHLHKFPVLNLFPGPKSSQLANLEAVLHIKRFENWVYLEMARLSPSKQTPSGRSLQV